MESTALISEVKVATYRFPTDTCEADGTFRWDATELVLVRVYGGGQVGLGYSYTAARAAANLVRDLLAPNLVGKDLLDLPHLWSSMIDSLRNVGRPGLGMMAVSAVDQALWDLKARFLGVSLSALWGCYRHSVPVYGSGGFITYSNEQMQHQLAGWMELELAAVKIKVGEEVQLDVKRAQIARSIIGPDIALMVDANGAYDRLSARALMEQLQACKVRWVEEPVSSDDLDSLRWLRDQAPPDMAVAAGEYGWDGLYFRRMLAAGGVDVLQVDATRCGYTGFLQAAQLCEVFQVPLSAHCAPALHASICAVVPRLLHLEYFHDHARIETMMFADHPELKQGKLWPNRDQPGHGLSLREQDVEEYLL